MPGLNLSDSPRLHYLVLAIVSVLLYVHTLFHDFVYDDKIVIVENEHVTGGLDRLDEIWTTNYLNGYQEYNDALYRPLSPTVFNVLHNIFGLNSSVFHLFNILFYALLVILIYHFFSRLFPGKREHVFWGTLLFAAHPIHTEVVANVKSLDEILALIGGVMSCFFALKFIRRKSAFAGVLFFYVMALFSKESAISFLLIIPLVFYFRSDKLNVKKLSLLVSVLAFVSAAWYIWHESVISNMPGEVDQGLFSATSNTIIGIEGPVQRFITGLWLITKYFFKLIVPWPLYGDYSFNTITPVSFISWRFAATLVFLALSTFLFFRDFLKKTPLVLGILIFFVAIIPTSNVLLYIGTTFAERLAFTASLAVIPWVVSLKGLKQRFVKPTFILIFLLFSILTVYRAAEWKSFLSLFEADVKRNPDSFRTHYNYGTALNDEVPIEARTEEEREILENAISELKWSLEIMPTHVDARLNLGNSYKRLKEWNKAISVYDQVIAEMPSYTRTYFNKGIIQYQLKRYEEARQSMLEYTDRGREHLAAAWYWAGVCSGYLNEFETAIDQLNRSLQIDDTKWEAWNYLGMAYGNSGKREKALEAFSQAYAINPGKEVEANLDMARRALGEDNNNSQ